MSARWRNKIRREEITTVRVTIGLPPVFAPALRCRSVGRRATTQCLRLSGSPNMTVFKLSWIIVSNNLRNVRLFTEVESTSKESQLLGSGSHAFIATFVSHARQYSAIDLIYRRFDFNSIGHRTKITNVRLVTALCVRRSTGRIERCDIVAWTVFIVLRYTRWDIVSFVYSHNSTAYPSFVRQWREGIWQKKTTPRSRQTVIDSSIVIVRLLYRYCHRKH